MKRNLSDSYSIYDSCHEDGLPIEQFFITQFNQLPSKFEHDNDFNLAHIYKINSDHIRTSSSNRRIGFLN
jgi:hypothetical protein